MRRGVWRFVGSAAVALALIGLWQLGADAGLISPVFFPGPDRSFGTLWEQLHEAEFWYAFVETLRRMALGFVSAALIGIAAGALIGLSRNLRDYVEPTLELIRPLPASAVIPVFVLLIPIAFNVAKRTGKSLLLIGLPMVAGLSVVHGLIPPLGHGQLPYLGSVKDQPQ